MFDLIESLIDPMNADMQLLRFWLALLNLLWLVPIAVYSFCRHRNDEFPNGGLALPLIGIVVGLAGFSAIVAFDFEPTENWRTLLSLLISVSLLMLAILGALRLRGYDL